MKQVLLVLSMALVLLSGCKKDEEETDPRDQFIGTFTGSQTVNVPSLNWLETYSGNITITKSADAGKIILNDGTVMTAKVSGNMYVYDKYTETETYEGETITMEITGSATISNGIISETGSVTYHMLGGIYGGTWTRTMTRL